MLKLAFSRRDFTPALSGIAAELAVILVWRVEHWPYRLETAMAVLFAVMILVSTYRSGLLAKQPAAALLFAAVFAFAGAVIGHL